MGGEHPAIICKQWHQQTQSLMDFHWDYPQEGTECKGRMGRRYYLINYTLPYYTNAQSLSNKQEEMKLGINEH